ncbi:hypothetical protein EW145_g8378 [Phellinidium pouzarii]|uniref:DUF6699 domain-containing protein n=1 Tax=Phellinidium pouzarii TaxID=167371 RepID=A0A4S4K6L4_9AGAM|nr:hypothetical protein EW145_g8378 [Phellinidium pouzarii]
MPQFLIHYALAFNPQSAHSSYVEPMLFWDTRYPSDYARFPGSHGHRLPAHVASQHATSPPVPIFRIVCGLFPHRAWSVEAHNSRGVTVGDVLSALHRALRHRARVAEAYYARCRASADPAYEQRAGVRRIDWLLKSTGFVGLTPSVERGYTWSLTTKRAEK